ncbi:MAG: hypothetical protein ABW005_10410 [Burkholderiaceae bacterium]
MDAKPSGDSNLVSNVRIDPHAGCGGTNPPGNELSDVEFLALLGAFRASGGLAREADLLARWRVGIDTGKRIPRRDRPASTATALRLRWDGRDWLPLFQFQRPLLLLRLRQDVLRVRAELGPVFEDARLLLWFAEPNHWLEDARPIDRLAADPAGVLQAARGDRFLVAG